MHKIKYFFEENKYEIFYGIINIIFLISILIGLLNIETKNKNYWNKFKEKVQKGEYQIVYKDITYIYSLNLEKDISGSFILGNGSIETTNYYMFYYPYDDGYKLGKVESDIIVIQKDDVKPQLRSKYICTDNNYCVFYRKELIVPGNTIIKDIEEEK